jgi:hypothetical protein
MKYKKYEEMHEKLNMFIKTWVDAVYDTDEKKRKFYVYMGEVIQSRLMHDLVYLDDDYSGYQVAGTAPLMNMIRFYDIDEVYNNWIKEASKEKFKKNLSHD